MYKKILVPTDGSPLSEQAVASALEFARMCGASIVALSVAEPFPMVPTVEGAFLDAGVEIRTVEQIAQRNVEQVAKRAEAAGVPCTPVTVASTSPEDVIVATANEHGCDLIFMASHGRRGLSRLFAGSVAQNVLSSSTVPVLVLRPAAQEGGKPAQGVL